MIPSISVSCCRHIASTARLIAAAGGVKLFLDEIGDLSLETQARLQRILEERTFERVGGSRTLTLETRIVAATNRDLELMVVAGDRQIESSPVPGLLDVSLKRSKR